MCFDQKDLAKALNWFDKALADKPNCATAFFHRGQLHSIDTGAEAGTAASTIPQAVKDLKQCIELAPDFAMAYVQLGVTHARMGEVEKAVELLQKASQVAPAVPDIYNYLGETYMQLLQIGGAGVDLKMIEDMFDKAIKLDPFYPMAYINKGNLLLQTGSEGVAQALDLFKKAVEKCPRSKFAYCHLAQVYMAMQQYDLALEQIDKAVGYAFSHDELNELYGIRVNAETQQKAKKLLEA